MFGYRPFVFPWHCAFALGVALCCILPSLMADEATKRPELATDARATAAVVPPKTEFLRVRRSSGDQPVALETAIVSYRATTGKPGDLVVDLIAAVHVADKSYYAQLNKILPTYDALLYELVAPDGAQVPAPAASRRPGNPVTGVQLGLKSVLELEFQLEHIDYTHDNFVHADMSPEEFAKSMRDRGESLWQIFFRMLGYSAAKQSKDAIGSTDAALLMALFSPDRALRLKRVLADQFEDLKGPLAGLFGPDGSTILHERNKKALEVLRREIEAGKQHIGIFYGAGHLPDMEQRLESQFGLKRVDQRWLAAWSLQPSDRRRKSE